MDEEVLTCAECGEPMIENDDGTTNHLLADDEIDYDQDEDHVAIAEYPDFQ
jgi:hypothetical protein